MRESDYLAVSEAQTVDDLQAALVSFAHGLDFGLVNLAMMSGPIIAPGTVRHAGNTPEAYAESSADSALACADPVLQRLMRQHTPFFYDQAMYVQAGSADLWDAQAAHGYRCGVATALHLPTNEHILLGIDREAPLPTNDHRRTRLLAELQLLVVHAREAAERLLQFTSIAPANSPNLNNYELEVLRWTMHGKSAPVTAQIIGKSAATVNYHLQNAMRKLNVGSKHQAVTLALALGLLQG